MKSNGDSGFMYVLFGICALLIICFFLKKYKESFEGTPPPAFPAGPSGPQPNEVHKMIPPIPEDMVAKAKIALRTIITQRPDVLGAVKDVLSDPEIRPVIQDILGVSSPAPSSSQLTVENDYSFS